MQLEILAKICEFWVTVRHSNTNQFSNFEKGSIKCTAMQRISKEYQNIRTDVYYTFPILPKIHVFSLIFPVVFIPQEFN